MGIYSVKCKALFKCKALPKICSPFLSSPTVGLVARESGAGWGETRAPAPQVRVLHLPVGETNDRSVLCCSCLAVARSRGSAGALGGAADTPSSDHSAFPCSCLPGVKMPGMRRRTVRDRRARWAGLAGQGRSALCCSCLPVARRWDAPAEVCGATGGLLGVGRA